MKCQHTEQRVQRVQNGWEIFCNQCGSFIGKHGEQGGDNDNGNQKKRKDRQSGGAIAGKETSEQMIYVKIADFSHHDGAAPAPSVDGVVGSLNQEEK